MIEAVIFDMDGVLIDSEPLWRESLSRVMKRVGLTVTHEMTIKFMGIRTQEVIEMLYRMEPWTGKSQEEVIEEILDDVIGLIEERGKPMSGIIEAISFPKQQSLPIALASSSPMRVIDAIVDKLGIRSQFKALFSAEYEPYGKPHPAVFLTTAKEIGIRPESCLVIEDSINGVIAAKAAKMRVIAIPDPEIANARQFGVADYTFDSAEWLTESVWKQVLA